MLHLRSARIPPVQLHRGRRREISRFEGGEARILDGPKPNSNRIVEG